MQDKELSQCQPAFEQFCECYERVFRHRQQHPHFRSYLLGLLGPLERKSMEPIALEQGSNVRILQHFIGASPWDDRPLLVEHRRHVRETLGTSTGIFILDPTAFPKRGEHSVGVARQWCGQLGKEENCQVAVNLTYASEHGHTFLDRRLYLPASWASDGERRRACGVPGDVVFHPSWQLAYEMLQAATTEGLPHAWITGDEEFGKVPLFHDWLSHDGERDLFEVPLRTRVWVTLPQRHRRGPQGLVARLRKIGPGRPRLMRVDAVAAAVPRRAWTTVAVREASKGPIRVEAVAVRVRFHRGKKKARPEGWLVMADTLDQRRQRKFFQSNAGAECSLAALLRAGYARWPIEQDHGQGKNETGLGDYETRTWLGWHHHTARSFLAHHFLVIQRNRLGKKISRDDRRGDASGGHGGLPIDWKAAGPSRGRDAVPTAAQPRGAGRPLEASPGSPRPTQNAPACRCSTCVRHQHYSSMNETFRSRNNFFTL